MTPVELRPGDVSSCAFLLPPDLMRCLIKWPNRLVVAGGFVRDVVAHERPKDIDVFIAGKDLACEVSDWFKSECGLDSVRTMNTITVKTMGCPTQLAWRWKFSTPAELVEGFDFTACQAGIWWDGDQMRSTAAPSFYKDLEQKKLVYAALGRDDDRASALLRVLKFYQRGYKITLPSLSRVLVQFASEPKSSIGALKGCAASFEFLLRSRTDESTTHDELPYSSDAD